ncbi:MAG: hypothetical protein HYR91_02890 [Flavobacteriia bacterium]|nr:hypothetical protein [Flavobacteriia bacterium]
MTNFDSKEGLLAKIGEIYAKMEIASLEVTDLDELVKLSEELYQRNVILRYKAFEKKIFGETIESKPEIQVITEEVQQIQEENQELIQEEIENTASLVSETEQPAFSFSLFDEPSAIEPANEEVPMIDLTSEAENEPFVQAEFSIDSTIEKPLINEVVEPSTIEIDTVFTPQTEEIVAPIIHSEEIVTEYNDHSMEIEQSTLVEDPQTHEIMDEQHSYETIAIDEKTIATFMHKFREIESMMAGQFGITKLDSLQGSFGLNERLQYINELFDGSSEDFSNAVKTLDNQPSSQNAFLKVAEIGAVNKWDIQSETVEEFMQKIKRRYYA